MTQDQIYFVSLMVGVLSPFYTDFINRYVPSSKVRFAIAFFLSVIIAVIVNYQQIAYGNPGELLGSMMTIFGTSQIVYKMMYEKSKVQTLIRGQENFAFSTK